jgi:rod shape-determining protein MreC
MERSRYEGLAMGSGSDELPLVVQYVKKRAREEIQFGDLVITSGLQSLYPPGIKVGRVSKFGFLIILTSMELEIEPIIDFSRLEFVFIHQPENESSYFIYGGGS